MKKIPVIAVQFTRGNFDEIERFVGGDAEWRGRLVVATRQGPLWADDGDWIVKNEDGTFKTVKPDIFAYYHRAIKEVPNDTR